MGGRAEQGRSSSKGIPPPLHNDGSQLLERTGEEAEEARLYNKGGGREYEEQCKEYFC